MLIYPMKSYAWHIKNNKDLPKNKYTKILVYCLSGKRGPTASQILVDSGYKRVDKIQDGITAWLNTRYPIVIDPDFWELIILTFIEVENLKLL